MESLWAEGQTRASTCSSPWEFARHHAEAWGIPATHSTGNKARLLREIKHPGGFFPLKHHMLKNGEATALKASSLCLAL